MLLVAIGAIVKGRLLGNGEGGGLVLGNGEFDGTVGGDVLEAGVGLLLW